MEDAQRVEGNEAEKSDAMFHAAVDYGTPDIWMPRNLIADNDEPQAAVAAVVFEAAARHRERFDQARDILLRANRARVKQKRITNLVAFEDSVALARDILSPGRLPGESGKRRCRNKGSGAL